MSGPTPPSNLPPTPPTPTPPAAPGAGPSPSPSESLSNSPWAQMFPGGATPQDLQTFINNFLKMMVYQFKQQDQQWQQAQQRLKNVEEGKDPDE